MHNFMRRLVLVCVLLSLLGKGAKTEYQTSIVHAETTATPPVVYVPGAQNLTLNQAILQVVDGGVIEVAAGTYTERVVINNQNKRFTIRAESGKTVVLSGASSHDVLRFYNSDLATGGHVVFEGLTFTNGYSDRDGWAGGVTVNRAEATFVNCIFSNNIGVQPTAGGGGLFITNGSKVFFINATFSGNTNRNYGGGFALEYASTAYVMNSQFINNRVNVAGHLATAAGGGIHVGNSTLRVANSNFDGNKAGYVGGAIYAIGEWRDPVTTPRTDVLIVNSLFNSNQAVADAGVTPPAPTEAGAVHAENQTLMRIYTSRFINNYAGIGGAISNYRSKMEVRDSYFEANRVAKMLGQGGFGGAISATSNDTSIDGGTNRPNASLMIYRTLFRGSGWGTMSADAAGGVYISGDTNRLYGNNGVSQIGTAADNRATLVLDGVSFSDFDTNLSTGHGGGAMVDLGNATINNSLFTHNRSSSGGALSVIQNSVANISNSAFISNTTSVFGGAVYASGVTVNISGSQFAQNALQNPGPNANESYGAALFMATMNERSLSISGTVSGNTFSENIGLPIYDRDNMTYPINDVRYNSNQFYTTYFSSQVYTNSNGGYCCKTVAQLNTLTIVRNSGVPSTEKSQVDNTALGSAAVIGKILAVPPVTLPTNAKAEPTLPVPAYLAFGWGGGSASVDGVTVTGYWGIRSTTLAGTHTLQVGSSNFTAVVEAGAIPDATLQVVQNGTALAWNVTSGEFLDAAIDQEVTIPSIPSGQVTLSYNDFLQYRLYVITTHGGVVVLQAQDPLLYIPVNPVVVLIGLNRTERDGYIPIVNSGGGTLNWTASTGDTSKITLLTTSGSTQMYDRVKFNVKLTTPGTYNASVLVNAGAAGSESVSLNIIVMSQMPVVFLPLILRP